VQIEAACWGILSAINGSLINPLLISRGASALALGVYNSGANFFGFGSGWVGPRLASRMGSVRRATLACLLAARLIFLTLPLVLVLTERGAVWLLVGLVLVWAAGEGLALPLWTAFLTGLASPQERGRWLAMRATAATAASALVMLVLAVLLRIAPREQILPLAYGLASVAGLLSLAQLRLLFLRAPEPPLPAPRSIRALPDGPARRFLGGVLVFWFGAGLIWPVVPAYIIKELGAPTAYFAAAAVVAAGTGVLIQRRWGWLADNHGASRVLLLGGIGAGIVPALWALTPTYWLGFGIEVIAAAAWPGHTMGLTLRSVELAEHEADRPNLLAWTSLAQGTGAFFSPLIASVLVGVTGAVPLLFASAAIRLGATAVLAAPPSMRLRRWGYSSVPSTGSPFGHE
jgi:MFS family permease